jgi:hypothetical protein
MPAAPLIMENGRDLLEMVCTAYETPDEEVDEEEGGGHNFSERGESVRWWDIAGNERPSDG